MFCHTAATLSGRRLRNRARKVAAVGGVAAGLWHWVPPLVAAAVALVLAAVMVATAVVGVCPLYVPMHFDTQRKARAGRA